MNKEIIDFKSDDEYFKDEKSGLKNNTTREIDIKEEKFQILFKSWKTKDYPMIRINRDTYLPEFATEDKINTMDSFLRNIRHIAVYKNLMIITWVHEEVKK